MVNSFTGTILTDNQFVTVESVTVGVEGSSFTRFTAGKCYTFQIRNFAQIKYGDAIFDFENVGFQWKATDDSLYIRTFNEEGGCKLVILEGEDASN